MTALSEITSAMEEAGYTHFRVEAETVKKWLASDDIEVLGAAYSFVMKPRFNRGIVPPLTLEDYKSFLLKYYERCFREDPQSNWADSRYSAGWDLANWINGLWKDGHKDIVLDVRDWLANLYRDADSDLRTCIVNATLEHVLDTPAIATAFKNWKSDPALRAAYVAGIDPRATL